MKGDKCIELEPNALGQESRQSMLACVLGVEKTNKIRAENMKSSSKGTFNCHKIQFGALSIHTNSIGTINLENASQFGIFSYLTWDQKTSCPPPKSTMVFNGLVQGNSQILQQECIN